MTEVMRAAILMEEALRLLDEANEGRAAALLDHAINCLPDDVVGDRGAHAENANPGLSVQ